MLRSVKYGLYGAVLAGVVGGSVAWSAVDKTVTLVVDGQTRRVHTTATDVSGVLTSAGYRLSGHDLIAPSPTSSVSDGSRVVLQRGRLLHLDVNGVRRDVWTTAPTVDEALAQLGYTTSDFTSVSRSRRLPLSATDISVRTARVVTVVADGGTRRVETTEATVADLLADLGITLGPKDAVSARPASALTDGQRIVVTRHSDGRLSVMKTVPYPTTTRQDPTLAAGRTVVVRPGRDGLARVTYAVVYVDGKVAGRTRLSNVVVTPPVPRIVKVGTKPAATDPAAATAAAPSGPIATPQQAMDIARRLVSARGWGADQFDCLANLWGHESGWRVTASNPSGAYGIPQALPGSKMGDGWQTDAKVQITWGLNYIAARYSTPCGAWATWQAQGGWY